MQGPRRKWRPRILLLTAAFGLAAASHIAALPVTALLGLALMLWIAEGRRSQCFPWSCSPRRRAGPCFACYGFSPDAFSYLFRSAAGFLSVLPRSRPPLLLTLPNAGITLAAAAAVVLYPRRYAAPATSATRLRCSAPCSRSCWSQPAFPAPPGSGRCRSFSPSLAASLPTPMKGARQTRPGRRSLLLPAGCLLHPQPAGTALEHWFRSEPPVPESGRPCRGTTSKIVICQNQPRCPAAP